MQRTYSPVGTWFRTLKVFIGIGLSGIASVLFAGALFGWLVNTPEETVGAIGLTVLMLGSLCVIVIGAFIALAQDSVTIDTGLGTVTRTVRAGVRLFERSEPLAEFGAITLASGGGGSAFAADGSRFSDRTSCFHVCLVRAREEAARIACSWPEDVILNSSGPQPISKEQVTVANVKRYFAQFFRVDTVVEDAEAARRVAADLAEFTGLPYGHPTLGPDAPDESMRPLHLAPELCLDRSNFIN